MNIDKVLKGIVFTGIFAALLIPFVVENSFFFPFITPKNFLFRTIVEVIFIAWFALALKNQEYRPKKSWISISVLALLVSLSISTFVGENPYKSFWSNFERMEGLIAHVHMFAYFFVIGSMLVTEKVWEKWLKFSLVASGFMGMHVLVQVVNALNAGEAIPRAYATLGNASYLASYALFNIFFALLLWFRLIKDGKKEKILGSIFYGLIIFLNLNAVYWTSTRGTVIALGGGFLLMSILLAIKEQGLIKKVSLGILIAVLLSVGSFFAIKDTELVTKSRTLLRLSNISLSDKTTEARFVIWGIALDGVKENPVFGWGPGNFNLVFNKYYKPSLYHSEIWFDRAHNIVMDWFVSTGIVGLTIYLGMFWSIIYYLWREGSNFVNTEKATITALLAAYFFHNLFVFDNLVSYWLFFSLMAYVHYRETNESKPLWAEKTFSDISVQVLTATLVVVMSFGFYFGTWKPVQASRHLITGLSTQLSNPAGSLSSFKKVFELDTFGSIEASEHFMPVAVRLGGLNIPDDTKQEFLQLAKSRLEQRVKEAPEDIRPKVFLADFYRSVGMFEQAHKQIDSAIVISPRKQHLYATKSFIYFQAGDKLAASNVLKQAFELDTSSPGDRIAYASSLVTIGQFDSSDQILSDVSFLKFKSSTKPAEVFDLRLLNANIDAGRWSRVVEMWEAETARRPLDTQAKLSLSAAYLQTGRSNDAIKQINKVIEINPNFEEQGKFLISEILAGRNPIQ